MSRDCRDILRIARATNSLGRSGKANFPVPALIMISHALTAERYSSDEPFSRIVSALWFSLGLEIRLWIRTLVSSKYFTPLFAFGAVDLQTNPKSRLEGGRRSHRQS